eukprot:116796-Chlamydomonas_euryale.AAC.2
MNRRRWRPLGRTCAVPTREQHRVGVVPFSAVPFSAVPFSAVPSSAVPPSTIPSSNTTFRAVPFSEQHRVDAWHLRPAREHGRQLTAELAARQRREVQQPQHCAALQGACAEVQQRRAHHQVQLLHAGGRAAARRRVEAEEVVWRAVTNRHLHEEALVGRWGGKAGGQPTRAPLGVHFSLHQSDLPCPACRCWHVKGWSVAWPRGRYQGTS